MHDFPLQPKNGEISVKQRKTRLSFILLSVSLAHFPNLYCIIAHDVKFLEPYHWIQWSLWKNVPLCFKASKICIWSQLQAHLGQPLRVFLIFLMLHQHIHNTWSWLQCKIKTGWKSPWENLCATHTWSYRFDIPFCLKAGIKRSISTQLKIQSQIHQGIFGPCVSRSEQDQSKEPLCIFLPTTQNTLAPYLVWSPSRNSHLTQLHLLIPHLLFPSLSAAFDQWRRLDASTTHLPRELDLLLWDSFPFAAPCVANR